jgi:uncharacterized coiled-coil DUF342 family protein
LEGAKRLSDEISKKAAKLNQELKSLKQQWNLSRENAKRWAEKRDALHKQIKDLRMEVANLRERRDTINGKVKALKVQRNQTRTLTRENAERIRRLKENLQLLYAKKPKKSFSAVRREKQEIEWKIQTTSLTLQEEKPLVEKANQLKIQLETYQQINNTRAQIPELQNKIAAMNEKAERSHTQLSELAQQSQELHRKMIENIAKAKALQIQADEYHKTFIENKQKTQKIREKYIAVEKRIKNMRRKLAEKEEKEKQLQQEKTRKKLKAEALTKLEKGKKLSLEEFKLLAEKET